MASRDDRRERRAGLLGKTSGGAFSLAQERTLEPAVKEQGCPPELQAEMPRPSPVPRHKVGLAAPNRTEFPARTFTALPIKETRHACIPTYVDFSQPHTMDIGTGLFCILTRPPYG